MHNHESKFVRVARVVAHLATHPRHLGPYLSTSGLFDARTPLDLHLPWFALSAIEFLDSYVTRSMQVFEYGSGGSTLYFAKRAGRVVSTEHSEEWLARVQLGLSTAGLSNAHLQHRPCDFRKGSDFAKSDYLNSLADGPFDIIVVDGPEGDGTARVSCFRRAESRIRQGGIIIVDDSYGYVQLRNSSRAKYWREFTGVGPARRGVTSTDIYFF
jgi:hypothetical protein